MSSDQYLCGACNRYCHELDLAKNEHAEFFARLICKDCKQKEDARLSPLPDNSHYAKLKMQPWDYIIANELNFFEGNVVKYVTRWRHKNGLDDLRKARVYVDELIRQEEAKEKS